MSSIIIEDLEDQHFLAQDQQHGPSRTQDPETTRTSKAKATKTTWTSKAKAAKTTKTSKAKETKSEDQQNQRGGSMSNMSDALFSLSFCICGEIPHTGGTISVPLTKICLICN